MPWEEYSALAPVRDADDYCDISGSRNAPSRLSTRRRTDFLHYCGYVLDALAPNTLGGVTDPASLQG